MNWLKRPAPAKPNPRRIHKLEYALGFRDDPPPPPPPTGTPGSIIYYQPPAVPQWMEPKDPA